ncbi:MAG: hypothetical protein PWP52_322 [Bacteroidales bacterium]|jgi:hypothetical protein|nr:hypothetical protein [Bacteroidales bacterium]
MNKKYHLLIAILLIVFPAILHFTIKNPVYQRNIEVIEIAIGFCIGLGINIILSFILKHH